MQRMLRSLFIVVCVGLCTLVTDEVHAALNDWAEGLDSKDDGATRDYYNRGGLLAWKRPQGDWVDAKGVAYGATPYATANVADTDKIQTVTFDVTTLVQSWVNGTVRHQGFFLRQVKGNGPIDFSSREEAVTGRRPKLILELANGPKTLSPIADTYLDKSTYQSQGQLPKLRIRPGTSPTHALVRFSLQGLTASTKIIKATLQMTTTAKQYGGAAVIGVFRCQQGELPPTGPPTPGIAANYSDDTGITKHPDVLFADTFESATWKNGWSSVAGSYGTVAADAARKFVPFFGKALRARLPKGGFTALSAKYDFQKKLGSEPEEIYFRYYLRFGDDWNQTVSGGKLPGIAGTYGVAGWGGRKSDGTNGWSARGQFSPTIPAGNPLAGLTPIGSYVYHAQMAGTYGDSVTWTGGYGGFVAKNKWVCVEQHIKLNVPNQANGILRTWVNGHLAYERKDLMYRKVSKLKIENIWMNIYHGGKTASPHEQHVFIDNVVVARQYIGPVSSQLKRPPPQPDAPPSEPVVDAGTPDIGVPPERSNPIDQGSPDVGPVDVVVLEQPGLDTHPPIPEQSGQPDQRPDQQTSPELPVASDTGAGVDQASQPDALVLDDHNADGKGGKGPEAASPSGCGCHLTPTGAPLGAFLVLLFGFVCCRRA